MSKIKKETVQSANSIKITVPFTAEASKNRKFAYRSSKCLSEGYKKFVGDVTLLVHNQQVLNGVIFKDRVKLYVRLTLYRLPKQTRTDSHNFLEAVCDGIKEALQIDDCWYAGSWDWQVVDSEPHFTISISQ